MYEHRISLAASGIQGRPETGEKSGGAKRGRGRRMPSQSWRVLMAVALLKGEQAWRAAARQQLLLVTEVLESSLPLKTELCGL